MSKGVNIQGVEVMDKIYQEVNILQLTSFSDYKLKHSFLLEPKAED